MPGCRHPFTSSSACIPPDHVRHLRSVLVHPSPFIHGTDMPRSQSAVQQEQLSKIYCDFLFYLFENARIHIRERYKVEIEPGLSTMDIILSHPNHWNERQQRFLEKAVIRAGILEPVQVGKRLHFVEEAEAAASFALLADTVSRPLRDDLLQVIDMHAHPRPLVQWLTSFVLVQEGTTFVVCDAGGSTIDISAYRVGRRKDNVQAMEELIKSSSTP